MPREGEKAHLREDAKGQLREGAKAHLREGAEVVVTEVQVEHAGCCSEQAQGQGSDEVVRHEDLQVMGAAGHGDAGMQGCGAGVGEGVCSV